MRTKTYRIFLLLMVAACTAATAQTKPPTALEKAADEICESMNAVDITNKTAEDVTKLFQDMMVKTFANDMDALMAEMGFTTMDGENGRKIGEEIGRKLLLRCPKFVELSVKMAKDKEPANDEESVSTSDGTIARISSPEFNEIVVKDAAGRETTFYWLRYFKGSENFESATTNNIGKKVKVSFTEMECYLPKAHGYYKIKVLKAIDFLK